MTADLFLASLNVIWNIASVGLLIAVLRSLWTIEAQADEGIQLLREIKAELDDMAAKPKHDPAASAWNTQRPD